jgi:cellulose biosynthesis protein BcsQ
MKAKAICFASAKGGSGKTILATTFATFLAAIGKRVLLIDTDASTNGLTLMHLKEVLLQTETSLAATRQPRGIYEIDPATPAEIIHLPTGVHLIPATYAFQNTDTVPVEKYRLALTATLTSVRRDYDYVFIDAQAGSDEYAHVALSRGVCDEVVIVSEYDPISAAGVERLKGLFREDLTYPRTWILLNKMLPDFVNAFSDFLEVARYLSPIPWDAEVVRAYARRKVALDFESGNAHTLAVAQTLRSLLGDEIAVDMEEWMARRSVAIREPIAQQYADLERELEALIAQRFEAETVMSRRSVLQKGLSLASMFGAITLTILYGLRGGAWYLLAATALAILSVIFFNVGGKPATEQKVIQERFRRRQQDLEERLSALRTLRDADLQTLINARRGR